MLPSSPSSHSLTQRLDFATVFLPLLLLLSLRDRVLGYAVAEGFPMESILRVLVTLG